MPSRNSAARLAFFANKEEIRAALERWELISEIYARLEIPGSYAQFRRNIRQHIQAAPVRTPRRKDTVVRSPAVPSVPHRETVRHRQSEPRVWNPAALDRKTVLRAADPERKPGQSSQVDVPRDQKSPI